MNHLKHLLKTLKQQEKLHAKDIYNYVIPVSWNLYGYPAKAVLKSRELIVNPYGFYLYTLQEMLKKETLEKNAALQREKNRQWLGGASIYAMNIRAHSAWDHDRDDRIKEQNLYQMKDNGTFLKSMILLPFLRRMGINTILLSQIGVPGSTAHAHERPVKEAIRDFRSVDEALADSLLEMDAKAQCAAFIEVCHLLNIRVILEYCPGKLARDNVYCKKHPEWFYWIRKGALSSYSAPGCPALPQNTIPHTYALKDFYRSEEVKKHLALFRKAPDAADASSLADIEQQQHVTIAPAIVDQINAHIPADPDTTIFRLYEQPSSHIPKETDTSVPYLSEDTIRYDLHPGKKPISELWIMLCDTITWYQKELYIDGILLQKPYLLSEKLQKELVRTARKRHPDFAVIVEENILEASGSWLEKGFDAITGNSGYENSDIWNRSFQTFAYRLQNNPCLVLAAGEFYDSRRICCMEGGHRLSILLHVMNGFLPNAIPFMLNSAECFEVQPLQLSEYGDKKYLYSLPKEDARYLQQPYLDACAFDYRSKELNLLPSLLEPLAKLRAEYVSDPQRKACIPVWFNSPKDPGLGFTYIKEDSALMAVANTDLTQEKTLCIHTENLLCELPFQPKEIRQIFSTKDPYLHDVAQDSFRNLPLRFDPGEVKFLLFQAEGEKTSPSACGMTESTQESTVSTS